MRARDELANRFEAQRGRLQAIAYRMLGSAADAEDAVQEAWLRLGRAGSGEIQNFSPWLTTVVSRICLDMLRARAARREAPVELEFLDQHRAATPASEPEEEAQLADAVGRALLVVLDRLAPAERVVLVLHEMFGVPFSEIAPVVGRSTVATKKAASRARQRVRGTPEVRGVELLQHRRLVEAFLAASRAGDLDAVLAVLDPQVVRRADRAALQSGRAPEVRGARAVAEEIVVFGRNARFAELALVDGAVGMVVAPGGRLQLVVRFTIEGDTIRGYELIADPIRLHECELAAFHL